MAFNKQEQQIINTEKKKEKTPMDKKSKLAIAVFAAVVVLIAAAAIVVFSLQGNGTFLRSTVGFESDHFRIDNAMFSYYMYDEMYERVENEPELYKEHGFDVEKPLREQMFDDNNTWFDYFNDRASEKVEDILIFLEAATNDDIALDMEDFDKIDKEMALLEKEAAAKGLSTDAYITSRYGKGVRARDVRSAKEYYAIAEKEHDNLYNTLTYEDEAIEKFHNDYRQLFLKADCLFFSVDADTSSMTDKDAIEEARTEARAEAEKLIQCTTQEEFLANIQAYLDENVDTVTAEEKMAAVLHENYAYVPSNKMSSWLFSGIRVAGDKTVIKFSDDLYTAIYVIKPAENDVSVSKNVRDIYFDYLNYETEAEAEAAANKALETYKAGELTEDAFGKLAGELSEDKATAIKDGLVANVDLTDDVAFAAWANDEARKAGDTEIIKDKDGVHVLYFVGTGREGWKNTVEDYMRAKDYQDKLDEILETITITRDKAKYTQIKERAE